MERLRRLGILVLFSTCVYLSFSLFDPNVENLGQNSGSSLRLRRRDVRMGDGAVDPQCVVSTGCEGTNWNDAPRSSCNFDGIHQSSSQTVDACAFWRRLMPWYANQFEMRSEVSAGNKYYAESNCSKKVTPFVSGPFNRSRAAMISSPELRNGCYLYQLNFSIRFSGTVRLPTDIPQGEGLFFLVAWYREIPGTSFPSELFYIWGHRQADYGGIVPNVWVDVKTDIFAIPSNTQIRIAFIASHNNECIKDGGSIQIDNIVSKTGSMNGVCPVTTTTATVATSTVPPPTTPETLPPTPSTTVYTTFGIEDVTTVTVLSENITTTPNDDTTSCEGSPSVSQETTSTPGDTTTYWNDAPISSCNFDGGAQVPPPDIDACYRWRRVMPWYLNQFEIVPEEAGGNKYYAESNCRKKTTTTFVSENSPFNRSRAAMASAPELPRGCFSYQLSFSIRFSETVRLPKDLPQGKGLFFLVAWYIDFPGREYPSELFYIWGHRPADYDKIVPNSWAVVKTDIFAIPPNTQIRIAFIASHNNECIEDGGSIQIDNIVNKYGPPNGVCPMTTTTTTAVATSSVTPPKTTTADCTNSPEDTLAENRINLPAI